MSILSKIKEGLDKKVTWFIFKLILCIIIIFNAFTRPKISPAEAQIKAQTEICREIQAIQLVKTITDIELDIRLKQLNEQIKTN